MPEPAFLVGETVTLRPVEEEDVAFVHETVNAPEVWRMMRPARAHSRDEIRSVLLTDPSPGVRLLVAVGSEPVGLVGYTVEDETAGVAALSCWIHPSRVGEGYGTEAVELLVGYGFDQRRLHKFVAEVVQFNEASRRLVEKVGFVAEGRQRKQAFVDGAYHDCLLYGLLAADWRSGDG